MTDEEKALELAKDLLWRMDDDGGWDDLPGAMKDIIAALAAVREECAKVAEDYAEGCKNADERIAMDHCVAIAQAIRTRTE